MKKCRIPPALPIDRTPASITHPHEAWGHRWPKAATPLCSADLSHEEISLLCTKGLGQIHEPVGQLARAMITEAEAVLDGVTYSVELGDGQPMDLATVRAAVESRLHSVSPWLQSMKRRAPSTSVERGREV